MKFNQLKCLSAWGKIEPFLPNKGDLESSLFLWLELISYWMNIQSLKATQLSSWWPGCWWNHWRYWWYCQCWRWCILTFVLCIFQCFSLLHWCKAKKAEAKLLLKIFFVLFKFFKNTTGTTLFSSVRKTNNSKITLSNWNGDCSFWIGK